MELVNLLLDKGLDINAKNAEGISILHYAAESGSLELVKFLLDRGADINVKTTEGTTILHYAAKSGSVELVKFLLDKGLDVNAIGRLDLTPLEEAIRSHSVKLTEFLFDKVKPAEKKRIAEYAALYNAIDIIKLILSKNLIDKDEFIHELLSEASYREQTEIIKFLLSIGVDINMTIKGSSPLIIAIDKGEDFGPSNDFIEFMILQGANINVKDRDGMTPLLYAAKYGYIGIVSVLLNNGADPTICDKEKFAPLHYAKDDVMQELIIYALEMKEKQVIFSRLLHKQAKMNLRIHYNQR